MSSPEFWDFLVCMLGVGGIAFACVMFGYFIDFCRQSDEERKKTGKISYTSIILSSIMILGVLICFIFGVAVLVSGILSLVCD
ncbi:MAG: hypothetical protein Q8L24_00115 [bacterium]|nr:hypothetical protein [bacterium]